MVTREDRKRYASIWGFIGIFVLVIFIPVAQAETPFDITYCDCGTITMVSRSKELTVFSLEGKGIIFSNHENKAFDNITWQFVGVNKVTDGKRTALNYGKWMDPDGDTIVVEIIVDAPEKTLKFLQGSGKWKGIKGGGKGKGITKGKPIEPGTFQSCSRYIGTFELPPK